MRCDERYRSGARQQPPSEVDPDLCRAELIRVSPCPARPRFRELHFDVAGTAWSWCFPPRADCADPSAVAPVSRLVLLSGPHGLRAQSVTVQSGYAVRPAEIDLATAAGLALSAVPVYVHRFLIGRVSPEPGELGQAQESRGGGPSAGAGR